MVMLEAQIEDKACTQDSIVTKEKTSFIEHLGDVKKLLIVLKNYDSPQLVLENAGGKDKGTGLRFLKIVDSQDKKYILNLPSIIDFHIGSLCNKFKYETATSESILSIKADKHQTDDTLVKEEFWNIVENMTSNQCWNKKNLKNYGDLNFVCKHCTNAILIDTTANCKKFNDMPSEYWQEFMDYWHCHKPDYGTDVSYLEKYNKLRPSTGEVLIGDSSFLGVPDTFKGRFTIKDTDIENDKSIKIVQCLECNNDIGEVTKDDLISLYKWKLKLNVLQPIKDDIISIFPPEKSVLLSILNISMFNESQYIKLQSKGKDKSILFLWLFKMGNDVVINDVLFENTTKILYHAWRESDERMKDVQELTVEQEPFDRFLEQMEKFHSMLPSTINRFLDYEVTYIPI